MRKVSALLLLIILLSACSSENTPASPLDKNKDEWNKKVEQLGQKYSAFMNWEEKLADSLTIQKQSELKGKTVLFKDYYLEDVYRDGTSTIAKFNSYVGNFLILKVGDQSVQDKIILSHGKFNTYYLVVEVKDVTVPEFSLASGTGNQQDYVPIEVSTDTLTYVTGKLIDFIAN